MAFRLQGEMGMRIAIPQWQGRVAPVFDVCGHLLMVETDGSHEVARQDIPLGGSEPHDRVRRLAALGVDVLICGAVSRHLEAALTAAGIRVLPFVCGPVEAVLSGFHAFGGAAPDHHMPGCRRRRQRQGRGRR